MQENAKLASDRITLNVGGKFFATSKTNLLRFEGSYFHGMLASGHWKPDSDGAYFIDLNAKNFDRVLDYMRTGELTFAGLRPDQVQQLHKTLDYLLLNPPMDESLRWDPQCKGSSIALSDNNRVATNGSGSWQAVQSTTPRTRFTVRVVSRTNAMIGFAPRAGFNPKGATYTSCGWYFYTFNGDLFAQGVSKREYGRAVGVDGKVTAMLDRDKLYQLRSERVSTGHSAHGHPCW